MAARPIKGLIFNEAGYEFVLGLISDVEMGLVLVFAKQKSAGVNDYEWIKQSRVDELTYNNPEPTDVEVVMWVNEFKNGANEKLKQLFGTPVGNSIADRINRYLAQITYDLTSKQIIFN